MFEIWADYSDYGINPERFNPSQRLHASYSRSDADEVFSALQGPGNSDIDWTVIDTIRYFFSGPGTFTIDSFSAR